MPYLDTTGLDALWKKIKKQITAYDETKQDKLTAGDNITIDGSVISATAPTYGTATSTADGLMSAADKAKLDAITDGDSAAF